MVELEYKGMCNFCGMDVFEGDQFFLGLPPRTALYHGDCAEIVQEGMDREEMYYGFD